MVPETLKQRILDEISTWEIIDCHEHMPEERERTDNPVDALTLFGHYMQNDLGAAGMLTSRCIAAIYETARIHGPVDLQVIAAERIAQLFAPGEMEGLFTVRVA